MVVQKFRRISKQYLISLAHAESILGIESIFSVKYVKLGDISTIVSGGDIDKNNVSNIKQGEYIYPIYSNGIGEKSLYGYTNTYKIKNECITVSARGTIGWASLKNEKFYPIVRLICITVNDENILTSYVKYCLDIANYNIPKTGIPQLTIPMISDYKIPLPPLKIQRKIVEVLDKFQKLLSETEGLLPKEIEERQKQYEYYT